MLYLNFLSGKLTDACWLSVAIPTTPALLLALSASAVFPLAEGRIPPGNGGASSLRSCVFPLQLQQHHFARGRAH